MVGLGTSNRTLEHLRHPLVLGRFQSRRKGKPPPENYACPRLFYFQQVLKLFASWTFFLLKIRQGSRMKHMKKKYKLILILFIAGIIPLVFLFFRQNSWKKVLAQCDEVPTQQKNYCYNQLALRENNISICDKMPNQDDKDSCYWNFARGKEDLLICDKIKNLDFLDNCYRDIATAKEDLSICEKITDQEKKNNCYRNIAKAKQDPLVCDNIATQSVKNSCYSDIAISRQDLSICDKIQDSLDRDYCYLVIAKAKKDRKICDQIEYKMYRDDCRNDIK